MEAAVLDANRLRIFAAVAEEGSFTAAADKLYLSQSAVSQQMAILEREVGLSLMERVPRGIRLTPAGVLLAERAKSLLSAMSGIEQEMHRLANRPAQVRLGAFPTAGAHLIPLTVQAYTQRHPNAQITISPAHAGEVASLLREGAIHVGLVWDYDFAPRPEDAGLDRVHLLNDPLRVVLSKSHPLADRREIALVELAEEPWVVREHRAPYADAFETMCRIAGFEPHVVFRAEDYQSAQGLVAAGIGVSLVPELSLTARRPDVVTRALSTPTFVRRIAAVTLPEAKRDPTTVQLLQVLRQVGQDIRLATSAADEQDLQGHSAPA
jgi:DNA-binding transcriptional LysR family regulator